MKVRYTASNGIGAGGVIALLVVTVLLNVLFYGAIIVGVVELLRLLNIL